ncbi:MAG: polyprenyl diphosphate synthase [bacterium]
MTDSHTKPDLAETAKPKILNGLKSIDTFKTWGDWGEERHLLHELDLTTLPKHIAIIMDGNRRWARERNMHMLEGHRAGVRKAREVAELTLDINNTAGFKAIEALTFYAFSKENWNRSLFEVAGLMEIFEHAALREMLPLHERNMQVKIIGDLDDLPESLRGKIREIEELTDENDGLTVNFCLSYSGRSDILNGIKRIFKQYKEGKLDADSINEDMFAKYLDTGKLPDPDLLIRTSGEMRFSNFLLWQIAYTELWVTPVFWPDFDYRNYVDAISEYQRRDRRYGGG